MYNFDTKGVCAKSIRFSVDADKIKSVSFTGGCDGNLQGISRLVEGMAIDDAIVRLEGIQCGRKSTSCPDQLSQALKAHKANLEKTYKAGA